MMLIPLYCRHLMRGSSRSLWGGPELPRLLWQDRKFLIPLGLPTVTPPRKLTTAKVTTTLPTPLWLRPFLCLPHLDERSRNVTCFSELLF